MKVSVGVPSAAETEDAVAFELRNVSFSVKDRALLRAVTLTIPAGTVTGLIGHNGSGKSTLLKLLSRQQTLTSGQIDFEGEALAGWGSRAFARKVAYLPQHLPPANGLLVRELVALGRYPWHGALGRFTARDGASVCAAMDMTGTSAFAERAVDTLSGGERQRVWLAMLLAQEPGFLLLDEPISALDIMHQFEVLSLVRKLSEARRIGVVIVLHDVNMAARFCDYIVALHSGSVIAQGTPGEIMSPERLEEIYGIRMGVMKHPDRGFPFAFLR
jgi:iron complex transport system ATP-binding protein